MFRFLAILLLTTVWAAPLVPAGSMSASAAQSGRNRGVRPAEPTAEQQPQRPPVESPARDRLPAQGPARGRSTISGRVVYEGTDEPVSGARVHLSAPLGKGSAGSAVTGQSGEFRFENLAAGHYFVIARLPGQTSVSAAAMRLPMPTGDRQADDAAFEAARREVDPTSGVAEVSVDGSNAVEIEVRVGRPSEVAGTISGRVVYADARPKESGQVVLVRRDGAGTFGPTRLTTLTDESGNYRFEGVPPGEYLVRAQWQETLYYDQHGRTYGGRVVRGYYPSAAGTRGAAPSTSKPTGT